MVFSISEIDRSHESVMTHCMKLDKNLKKKLFCFANISICENDNTLVFLPEDASSKALQDTV